MKKLLMLGVSLALLSPAQSWAEEEATAEPSYQDAYQQCAELADDQASAGDDENTASWENILTTCLQEKGFTAPSDTELLDAETVEEPVEETVEDSGEMPEDSAH